ncbi:hypothetical protein BDI4_940012 [Burkholderia diffusa]|nr:hypothetical protein BDI4_940012 [Burkholderia diffusa]
MYRLIAYRGFESPSLRQDMEKPRKINDLRGFLFSGPQTDYKSTALGRIEQEPSAFSHRAHIRQGTAAAAMLQAATFLERSQHR